MSYDATPFARPLYALVKPVGARCNLACSYCYYPPLGEGARMSDELLDCFTRQYLEAQTQREVLFTWHGGEPTLLPVAFYERALRLQQRYAGWHVCDNALQTNGTLLSNDYCRFLHDHHFLVGLSLDGPEALHDAHRRGRSGQPSWQRVMQAVERLERHGVEWNAMAVVTPLTAEATTAFYDFFRRLGCRFLQCTPLFRGTSDEGESGAWWGDFLCTLWDEWYAHDVGRLFISLFESVIANRCGVPPGLCTLAPVCGDALVVEANGDVFSCDHFADAAHLLGNIRTRPLLDMAYGPEQQDFRQLKGRLSSPCHACPWLPLCHGECPANRLSDGRSYLCDGYRQFFRHAQPDIERLARDIGFP